MLPDLASIELPPECLLWGAGTLAHSSSLKRITAKELKSTSMRTPRPEWGRADLVLCFERELEVPECMKDEHRRWRSISGPLWALKGRKEVCHTCWKFLSAQDRALEPWSSSGLPRNVNDVAGRCEKIVGRRLEAHLPVHPGHGSHIETVKPGDGTEEKVKVLGLPITDLRTRVRLQKEEYRRE